jgi:hypothetical protein
MITFKRVAVWLVERSLEAFVLGGIFFYFVIRIGAGIHRGMPDGPRSGVWVCGIVVAVFLFVTGYYATTAIFGVIFRSPNRWDYPAITVGLFAVHTHIIFLRGGSDLTREFKAMELPFVANGAVAVFACSYAGNEVLKRWASIRPRENSYVSATGLTLLLFLLLNAANYLRPANFDSRFRPYGLPFTFYRTGGYVGEWVWRPGVFVWTGLIADFAVVAAVVVLLGTLLQRLRKARQVRE